MPHGADIRQKGRCDVHLLPLHQEQQTGRVGIGGGEIEAAVLLHLRKILGTPTIVNQLAQSLKKPGKEVNELLSRQTELWDEMFPAERNRLMHLLLWGQFSGGKLSLFRASAT